MDDRSLYEVLYTFFDWHPSRIKTFSHLIFALIKARTVRIKELANFLPSHSGMRAKISQIERFLLKQVIDPICFGKIILKLSCSKGKFKIAIDRTNWKFGKKNLNFFVAAIVYENISLPIAWLLLDKKGNSSTEERKILLEKVLKIVPKEQIEMILADREFVGEEWLKYLKSSEIPFAIRVKKNERIQHENGGMMPLGKFFSNIQIDASKAIKTKIYNKKIKINMTCLQLEKEQLFIASNIAIGKEALLAYKQRWSIERTFKSLKTAGFNLEDTHITDLNKLDKLFSIVSIALTLCVIAGEIKHQLIPIKIKKHGYKAVSLFTYGFDWLKNYFFNPRNSFAMLMFERLSEKITHALHPLQISAG